MRGTNTEIAARAYRSMLQARNHFPSDGSMDMTATEKSAHEQDASNFEPLISSAGLAAGMSLAEVVQAVSTYTGFSIEVSPVGHGGWGTLTGMLLVNEHAARVLIRRSDPRWYQLFVLMHELAHLLLGHHGCATLRTTYGRLWKKPIKRDSRELIADALALRLVELVLSPAYLIDELTFG